MKTKFPLLIACVFLSQAVLAQSFDIGVKAGATVSKIDGRSFRDEFKYGYHLGAFAEIGLGKKLSLQPELLFNQYQTRVDSNFKAIYENIVNNAYQEKIRLNYLSMPILLNYKLGNALSLQVGPQYGILIDNNKNLIENGEDAFKKGDFSLLGGAQLNVSKFRITGRYAVGLSNINDIDDKDKWNSQAYQISVGFGF